MLETTASFQSLSVIGMGSARGGDTPLRKVRGDAVTDPAARPQAGVVGADAMAVSLLKSGSRRRLDNLHTSALLGNARNPICCASRDGRAVI